MVIANGLKLNPISSIIEKNECTWFDSKVSKLDARKKWIISSIAPKGAIIIDDEMLVRKNTVQFQVQQQPHGLQGLLQDFYSSES